MIHKIERLPANLMTISSGDFISEDIPKGNICNESFLNENHDKALYSQKCKSRVDYDKNIYVLRVCLIY